MTRRMILTVSAAAMLMAVQRPPTLADAQPGWWDISGLPGTSIPIRQCVADVAALARFEHRKKTCTNKLLGTHGSAASFEYRCGAAGFGHSEIDLLTPRSLRISTQGISDGLPFNYVLQARRIGDCNPGDPMERH